MIQSINLKGKELQYDLIRKDVKNINLRIKANQSISVSASPSVELEEIEDFLGIKADYIISALAYYEDLARYAPQPKEYVDGETFLILGREQRLKVVTAKKNYVTSDESYITLYVKDEADREIKKRTMEKWLQRICQEQVRALCEAVYPRFQKYGVEYPVIRFRNMISQWGSCQPKRHILTFNYALVEAPLSCMEYVVVHEFNHFLHPNHSKRFYQQLAMFMPDWEQRKVLLEKYHNRTC